MQRRESGLSMLPLDYVRAAKWHKAVVSLASAASQKGWSTGGSACGDVVAKCLQVRVGHLGAQVVCHQVFVNCKIVCPGNSLGSLQETCGLYGDGAKGKLG